MECIFAYILKIHDATIISARVMSSSSDKMDAIIEMQDKEIAKN